MNRQMMIDHNRLASNIGTEKFQPHHGIGTISESPIDQLGAVGVMSVIKRGPTGVGASYSFTEPMGNRWHEVIGPEPLLSRPIGA